MRCLWLTPTDPEPRHNGQHIYSGGLIAALADADVELHVVGMERQSGEFAPGSRRGNSVWWLGAARSQARWRSLMSSLPHVAHRSRSRDVEGLLQGLLTETWDAIVFDGISSGWALRSVMERIGTAKRRPRLIYISHNHERTVRNDVVDSHPPGLRRHALRLDAEKIARLEGRLVAAVDLVTAITDQDAKRYAAEWPGKRIEVLSPGYGGRVLRDRFMDVSLPRRAVVVGSFDWIAKRMNLLDFVSVADPMFSAAGAELQIVGSADRGFIEQLRQRTTATSFTGPVDDVSSFMQNARIALVPEKHGGGFKLKVLDYVFHRLPILAIDGSVAGLPLLPNDSIMYYRTHSALARGALQMIDDFDRLNRLQSRAYSACSDRFHWRSRGSELRAMMGAA